MREWENQFSIDAVMVVHRLYIYVCVYSNSIYIVDIQASPNIYIACPNHLHRHFYCVRVLIDSSVKSHHQSTVLNLSAILIDFDRSLIAIKALWYFSRTRSICFGVSFLSQGTSMPFLSPLKLSRFAWEFVWFSIEICVCSTVFLFCFVIFFLKILWGINCLGKSVSFSGVMEISICWRKKKSLSCNFYWALWNVCLEYEFKIRSWIRWIWKIVYDFCFESRKNFDERNVFFFGWEKIRNIVRAMEG